MHYLVYIRYLWSCTMGSFDGAEMCELIGLFILNHLGKRFGKENIGLYIEMMVWLL